MIGIKRLAEHLNISIGTVSRALNNRPDVSEETRQRVLEGAAKLGYVANQSGRSLRQGTTSAVGFMIESGPRAGRQQRQLLSRRVRWRAECAGPAPSRPRRAALFHRRRSRALPAPHGGATDRRCDDHFRHASQGFAHRAAVQGACSVHRARAHGDRQRPSLDRPRFRGRGERRHRPAGGARASPDRRGRAQHRHQSGLRVHRGRQVGAAAAQDPIRPEPDHARGLFRGWWLPARERVAGDEGATDRGAAHL